MPLHPYHDFGPWELTPGGLRTRGLPDSLPKIYRSLVAIDYIRAHQYLYYVLGRPVLSDHDYDVFGRESGEDYKGGSDCPNHYAPGVVELAMAIANGLVLPLPES